MCATRLLLLLFSAAVPISRSQPHYPLAFHQTNNSDGDKPKMKAWFCDGKTQRNLVEHLRQADIVKSTAVQAVLETVDRRNYMSELCNRNPYADSPQSIPKGQTISAPHMHSYALEEIYPHLLQRQKDILRSGDKTQTIKVLDVGCGSGYLTACFARWFKPLGSNSSFQVSGKVFGMDIHKELVDMSRSNIQKADADLIDEGIVKLRVGNGWQGWKEEAPFDAIHVGAAASSVPMELVGQLLAPHGVLIVPVGAQHSVQKLLKIERVANSSPDFSVKDFTVKELLQVRYVPLVNGPANLKP